MDNPDSLSDNYSEKKQEDPSKTLFPSPKFLLLFILGIILILLVALYIEYRVSLQKEIEKEMKRLETKGISTKLKIFAKKWYPYPIQQNAADIYEEAFACYNISEEDEDSTLLPFIGQKSFPEIKEKLSQKTKEKIESFLKKNQKALQLLSKASKIPECRFPVQIEKGFECELPHIGQIQEGIKLFFLQSLLTLEKGDIPTSVESLKTSLRIIHALQKEPFLISMLIRISFINKSLKILERILNYTPLSKDQLDSLSPIIQNCKDPEGVRRGLRGEIAMIISLYNDIQRGIFPGYTSLSFFTKFVYQKTGLIERDFLFTLTQLEKLWDISLMPVSGCFKALDEWEQKTLHGGKKGYVLTSLLLPSPTVLTLYLEHIEKIHLALTSLAIEKYRLSHNSLPAKLADLTPRYLPHLFLIPYNKKPFRYKKFSKGYIIYSFGRNRKDDGGISQEMSKDPYKYDITFQVLR